MKKYLNKSFYKNKTTKIYRTYVVLLCYLLSVVDPLWRVIYAHCHSARHLRLAWLTGVPVLFTLLFIMRSLHPDVRSTASRFIGKRS